MGLSVLPSQGFLHLPVLASNPHQRCIVAIRLATLPIFGLVVFLALCSTAEAGWPNPGDAKTESGHPEILFTFDDGPHAAHTKTVLKILATYDVKAIFFWNGYRAEHKSSKREKRRKLVGQAVLEGHLVGNHTVNHKYLCKGKKARAAKEIDDNVKILEPLAKMPVFLFRAPYGNRCKRLIKMLSDRNTEHMHWDIDPQEWLRPNSKTTSAFVIQRLRNLKGRAILLMHDTKPTTARALPEILAWIKAENVRREKNGKKTIKVISGSEYLELKRDTKLWDFATDSAAAVLKQTEDATRKLIPGSGSKAKRRASTK